MSIHFGFNEDLVKFEIDFEKYLYVDRSAHKCIHNKAINWPEMQILFKSN